MYECDPLSHIAPFVYAADLSANGTYLKKSNIAMTGSQGRGLLMDHNRPYLLDPGDELMLSDNVKISFKPKWQVQDTRFTATQAQEVALFAHQYLVTGRLLGEGGYGKVLIGVDQENQRQLACKMVPLEHLYDTAPTPTLRLPSNTLDQRIQAKRKRWPTRVAACFREFDILKNLSHPNIVALEKVFWSQSTIYIFQELVTGGDLFSFLELKGGRLDNIQAAVTVRQILVGVEYLHDQGIVHRDLKPDNILMTSLEDGPRVVITDFGNARFLPSAKSSSNPEALKFQRMFSYVGTLEYAAPEIHKANPTIPVSEGYSKAVDMWSIGSITAAVLSGDVIFTNREDPDYRDNPRKVIMSLAADCDLSVLDDPYHPRWRTVADIPKDFIKQLLVLDECERMTATEALAHEWFANDSYVEDLEDVYAQSIAKWQPRQARSQLVEGIYRKPPNLDAAALREPSTDSKHNIQFAKSVGATVPRTPHAASTSQYWRANSPLPSIDEWDQDQFESQVQPSSISENASCHIRSRLSGNTAADGKYRYVDRHETESPSSTESLNNVTKTAYSQYPFGSCSLPTPDQEGEEYIQVHETPLPDQVKHTSWIPEESSQPTPFPEECRRAVQDAEESSVLVHETPLSAAYDCYDIPDDSL